MSAPLSSGSGALHTTSVASQVSEVPNPVSGASESTTLVPLGRTLSDIIDIRIQIEITLATISKNAPNKQELTTAVRVCLTECQVLLANVTLVTATTKAHAEALHRLLQGVHTHLQDRQVYGKRAQFMGMAKAFSTRPASPSPMHHVQIQEAFDALKNSLTRPIMTASQSTTTDANLQTNTVQSSVAPDVLHNPAVIRASPAFMASVAPSLQNTIPTSTAVPSLTNPTHSHSTPAAVEVNRPDTVAQSAATRPAAPAMNEGFLKRPGEEIGSKHGATTMPKKSPLWGTVVDTVDGGLRLLSTLTDFIPDPAGPIVKLMAGTGLTIIETLQGMADNQEEAANLGRYIGALVQTVGRFLEPLDDGTTESCDADTAKQLQAFLDVLYKLKKNLVELEGQGRFKQGVSHKTNTDDLKKWEITISRAFATLQAQLSLGSIRLLTKMNAANALQERDRLIGLLGDGDIGATEKSSNAADLMCLPGTRTHILDQVDQWIANPSGSRIFWISGVAGCGKSAVAATIAGRPRTIPTSIAVFYFVRGNQERSKRVLCSLSRQLARFGHGSLEQFILHGVKAKPDIATSHLDTQFEHLIVDPLKKVVAGSQPIVMVLDALDEWKNHEAVLNLVRLIKKAHNKLPSNVRFVLTSRNEPHLVGSLDYDLAKTLITRYEVDAVLTSEVGRDIARYIKRRFAKLCTESIIDAEEKPWPKSTDIDSLVMLSDGLFQWAATVTSYIGGLDPPSRLRYILKNPEQYRGLDNLYRGVLEGLPEEEMDERIPRLLQNVLGAILTAPAPKDATTIGYLCCDDLDTHEETMRLIRRQVLPRLASMFIIPRNPTQPITISHKSVLDFITDKERCNDLRFYTDLTVHQERIMHSCFRLMGSKLKQDICEINDPSKLNKDLQHQITNHVSLGLRYLCEHWVEYLSTPDQAGFAASRDCLENFSRYHLLHWIEVMSLTGRMERVIPMALDIERWLSACPSLSPAHELTQRLWGDTHRFVAMFSVPISAAPANIYISALRLAPTDTQLVQQFATKSGRGVRVTGGLLGKQWPPPPWSGRDHTKAVSCVSFSPDGRTILSGSTDNTLRIWNADSDGLKSQKLKGHAGPVWCASFSPNGRTILSGSWDTTLRLWDMESGVQRGRTLKGHAKGMWCASFSPDGETILSGSYDCSPRLWDANSGTQKGQTLDGHTGPVWCASFSPDGKTILSGSYDTTLRLWDAASGAPKGRTLKGHTGPVECASFSPNGKMILSGSCDTTLRLWEVGSGVSKVRTLNGHTGPVECASFSPDGGTVLSGSSDGTLRLWDVESGAQKGQTLKGHTGAVGCASFSPDGRTILSGSRDQTLRLWDAGSGAQKGHTLVGHTGPVWCASFSPDGRTILSGSCDTTLRLWDVYPSALKAEPRDGHTRGVTCFVFSPDGGTIISASYDKTTRFWDAETGALRSEFLIAKGVVSKLTFSGDGLTLMGEMYDGLSQEWDLMKNVHPRAPTRQNKVVKGCVSSDGWVFYRKIRWFWVPFSYADWLLCGTRLALRCERVIYIIDVSEIMYIVE